jgi:methylated-DNA-[protein]-cysteine S-methyltransferase
MTTYKLHYESPLGLIVAAASEEAITGLWFSGQPRFPKAAADWTETDTELLDRLAGWLDGYFAGSNPTVDLPLAPAGTPFQLAVWNELRQLPYGRTTTYGAIAERVAAPGRAMAAQAVGGAVGRNPISIVVPCHRVVGGDKSLTGYGGGLDRKEYLLRLEGVLPS